MLVIVLSFPQRVDENFDVAGEEPSPATEDFDPGQLASEGKPTSKHSTQLSYISTFFISCIYHSSIISIGLGLL